MTLRLVVERMAHGGWAVARLDGRVVFVEGAYPGETVSAEITGTARRYLEAKTVAIEAPSPSRVEPPCSHFGICGGCQWQSAGYAAQIEWKRSILVDQLTHLARMPDVAVRKTIAPGSPYGYRNRMDFRLVGGRPALSRLASHELVEITFCHLMAPPLVALFNELPVRPERSRVTIRAGLGTGESVTIFDRENGVLHERVDGVVSRITGPAFFQNNTAGAEALVGLVKEALNPNDGDVLVDGYAGGGLFSATVGRACRQVIGVESDRIAASDYEVNTGRPSLRISFETAGSRLPPRVDLVVVDPPR
ncbi:MAG: class I SAM-dependent RNA methyltransferase, partial [Acidimicrobiia bacterium]